MTLETLKVQLRLKLLDFRSLVYFIEHNIDEAYKAATPSQLKEIHEAIESIDIIKLKSICKEILNEQSIKDLHIIARRMGITNYKQYRKDELKDKINENRFDKSNTKNANGI